MIKFGIKLGLASGAIYYIAEQGVWKSSDEAVVICNKICENVTPYTKELTKQIPYEMPSLPKSNEFTYLSKYYWNKGVMASCEFLADLPSNTYRWTNQGIKAITESNEYKNLFSSEEKPTEVARVEKH